MGNTFELGEPTFFVQEAFGETITFKVAQVDVPLLDYTEDTDLHYLSEAFLCPASDLCADASPSSCTCNFTLIKTVADCGNLPPCCKQEFVQIYEELCFSTDLPSQQWRVLTPGAAPLIDVAEPGETLYFRYHPSADAACRGFGFDVIPPPSYAEQARSFGIQLFMSFNTSLPEQDSAGYTVRYTPTSAYEMAENIRFCPPSSIISSPNFFDTILNVRTAFIAVTTLSTSESLVPLPSPFQLQVVESNNVTDMTFTDAPAAAATCGSFGYPCIRDGQSIYGYGSSTASSLIYFSLDYSVPDACTAMSFNVRGDANVEVNLYVNREKQSRTAWFYNTTWMSRKIGPDSLVFFVCPDEPLVIGVNSYLGAGNFVLSVSSTSPYKSRSLATDISALWLGSSILGASRLTCWQATTASRFPLGDGRGDWRCTSWYGQWFENCRQYFPLGPSLSANSLWPPAPTPFGDVFQAATFNTSQLESNITYKGGSYSAIVLYDRINVQTTTGLQSEMIYWTLDQIPSCRIDFLNMIYDPVQSRLLRGQTDYLKRRESICSPNQLAEMQDKFNRELTTLSGLGAQSGDNVSLQTQAFKIDLLGLDQRWSNCTELMGTYSTATTITLGTPVQTPCSMWDACCPTASSGVNGLYDYCLDTSYSELNVNVPLADAINANCSNAACISQLITEAGLSMQYVSGEPIDKCAANANLASTFNNAVIDYVDSCRRRYTGEFGSGIECTTVADCPGADTGRVVCSPFQRNAALSSWDGIARRTCQTDSAFYDELVFDCLVKEIPPLLETPLRSVLKIPREEPFTGATARALLWDAISAPGCSSTVPTDSLAFTEHYYLLNTDDSNCITRDGCPLGLTCPDVNCFLPFMCQSPWRSCSYEWTVDTTNTVPTNDTCALQYQCNVVEAPADASSSTPVGTVITCNSDSDCHAACGMSSSQPNFCGYCDADLQLCFELTDVTSESDCLAVGTACYLPGVGQLQQCTTSDTLGSCDILAGQPATVSSSDACTSRTICSYHPGTRPIVGGYCQTLISYLWPACTSSVTTATGCSQVSPSTGQLLITEEYCRNTLQPLYPLTFEQWIDQVDTLEACVDADAFQICFIEGALPTLFNSSTCQAVGGTRRSPYTFRTGNYTASQTVSVSWQPRGYTSTGNYSTRLSYARMNDLWASTLDQYTVLDTISVAECRFFSPATTATSALACSCQPPDSPTLDETHSTMCQRLSDSSTSRPPATLASVTAVCRDVGGTLLAPPAMLVLPDTNFQFGPSSLSCLSLNISYISAAKFSTARQRIRSTSFFVNRQDEDIPPLAVFNSAGVVVGKILSDGVKLSSNPSHQQLHNVTLCIQVRSDFVEQIIAGNSSQYVKRFAIGIATERFEQINPLTADVTLEYFVDPSYGYNDSSASQSTAYDVLQKTRYVCHSFDVLKTTSYPLFAITIQDDINADQNGFSSDEESWMFATGAVYLAALLIYAPCLVITIKRLIGREPEAIRINTLSATILITFFVLRGALLIGLGTGAVLSNTTSEFALSQFAIWAEFTAIALVTIFLYVLLARSAKLQKTATLNRSTVIMCVFFSGLLLAILVAFLIAYAEAPLDDGISNTLVSCYGRIVDGETFWTTRRILRFTYAIVVALFSIVLAIFLCHLMKKMNRDTAVGQDALLVFNVIAVVATFALFAHSIIAIALVASGYNSFGFGLAMLWVTEIVPYSIFMIAITSAILRDFGRALSMMGNSIRNKSSKNRSQSPSSKLSVSSLAQHFPANSQSPSSALRASADS